MDVGTGLLVVLAGLAAGVINTVVGSGTLITFPLLLAAGVPPVAANVANNIGLAPGSVAGAVGYRHELRAHRGELAALAAAALVGGAVGAVLLTVLPAGWFQSVAPLLVAAAVLLVVAEPAIKRRLPARAPDHVWDLEADLTRAGGARTSGVGVRWGLTGVVFATSVYGGYFGAGQGVILLAAMTLLMHEGLQQVNAVKNVLQGVDNLTSAAVFTLIADPDWLLVGLLATGSVAGGLLGARLGRALPPSALRAAIVVIGVYGIVQLTR